MLERIESRDPRERARTLYENYTRHTRLAGGGKRKIENKGIEESEMKRDREIERE